MIQSDEPMFGILSEPTNRSVSLPSILLPNAGSTHHVGPNRLYVMLARRLSAAGFRCLRFDLPGLGDSVALDAAENDPYPLTATSADAAAMAAVVEHDSDRRENQRFIVMGLCSGAHTAFHSALKLGGAQIAESILINPLTFYYKPGMPLDQSRTNYYGEWQRYMQSARSIEHWGKLLRGDVHFKGITASAYVRFRDIAKSRLARLHKRVNPQGQAAARDDLGEDLKRIVHSGTKLSFVFARADPGYDLLMIPARQVVRRFRNEGLLDLWRIDNATHTFESKRSREELAESITAHLVERYAKVAASAEAGVTESVPTSAPVAERHNQAAPSAASH